MPDRSVRLHLSDHDADVFDAVRFARGAACLQEVAGLVCDWLNAQSTDPEVRRLVTLRRRRRAGLSVVDGSGS